jgi:hypothetical protein
MSTRYPLAYNGPLQIFETPGIQIGTSTGNGEGAGPLVGLLRLRNPGGENRIKLAIMLALADGAVVPGGGFTQSRIWVHEDEDAPFGGSGQGPFPLVDIDPPTGLPGLLFPASADLFGYSREFVTSAEYIGVRLGMVDPGAAGVWYAKALIYPASSYYPWEAWDQLRRNFALDCLQKFNT